MRTWWAFVALVLAAPAQSEDKQVPVFSAGVGMVSLTLTITDQKQRPAGGFTADDFKVYEDGMPQRIVSFQTQEVPLDLVIALDTSSSMRGQNTKVREAAVRLVQALRPGDEATVLVFARGVYQACGFTGDIPTLVSALQAYSPESDASHVQRSILVAMEELAHRPQDNSRRRAIVLLTDGDDNDPLADDDWLIKRASRSDAMFYIVQRAYTGAGIDDQMKAERDTALLQRLAAQSGGLLVHTDNPYLLVHQFEHIGAELRSQYRIGYEPQPPRPGGFWRLLQVFVRQPGLSVRCRDRYWAPKQP